MGHKIPLEDEFEYYIAHESEILARHRDRYVVIKGGRVLGAFDSEIEAVSETAKREPAGTFLVQHAVPGAHTQAFFSRVGTVR